MGGGSWEGGGAFGVGMHSGVHESASIAGSDFDYLHAPGGALYQDIGVCVCVCVCVYSIGYRCVCVCVYSIGYRCVVGVWVCGCVYSTRISVLIPTAPRLIPHPAL